ncbi:hypothetical protein KKC17_04250 [Patescibacteria group bacterium]|nr:hypothetical protein [Patescibacteria group bacterium]
MVDKKLVIIHCSDEEIQPGLDKWLSEQGWLVNSRRFSLPGGGQLLAREGLGQREEVLKQITKAREVDKIGKVSLINHSDCSAYGQQNNFKDQLAEQTAHLIDLEIAQEVLEVELLGLAVENYYAFWQETGTSRQLLVKRV